MDIPFTYLQFFTFFMFFFSVVAYTALDGFDLGVGNLMLFTKGDTNRRIFLNAIGPVWDGNSVWIVISAGTLFAGFPKVFATIMTAFYIPLTLLVAGFMLRAMAIEFRSKHPSKFWRSLFDVTFCFSSLTVTTILGLIIGNLIIGIPINAQGIVADDFSIFHPYAIGVSILNIILFSMHGAIYLTMKTEGALMHQIRGWVTNLVFLFLFAWVVVTLLTVIYEFKMMERFIENPGLITFVIVGIGGIFMIPWAERKGYYDLAFGASCASIALLVGLTGIGLYPSIVTSTLDPAYTLTLYNSSSGPITLKVIAIVVACGLPLSFFYLSYLYKVFHGKVVITEESY